MKLKNKLSEFILVEMRWGMSEEGSLYPCMDECPVKRKNTDKPMRHFI